MCCPGSMPRIGRPGREPSTAPMCGGRGCGCAPNRPRGLRMSRCTVSRDPNRVSPDTDPIDTEKWFVSDQRTIVVEDFFAPTTDAYLGLLRFLLGLDLIDRVVFWMLPVDDPLPWLLSIDGPRGLPPSTTKRGSRIVDVAEGVVGAPIRGRRRRHHRRQRSTPAEEFGQLSSSRPTAPNRPTGARNCTSALRGLAAVLLGGATGAVSLPPGWSARRIRRRLRRPIDCSRCATHHTPGSSSSDQRPRPSSQ